MVSKNLYNSVLFPTDNIDTNEHVDELFNLALGGAGLDAPLKAKNQSNNLKKGSPSSEENVT